MQTVLCMKWGTRYGVDFVNRLWSMVQRNTQRPTRMICYTDDPKGVATGVLTRPLPPINIPQRVSFLGWRKLSLFQYPLDDIEGEALFLDLDLVVTGPIDEFFDYAPGHYVAIDNWSQPGGGVGNTSVFRYRAGEHKHVFDDFNSDPEAILGKWRISQQYMSGVIPGMKFWPTPWCLSFKHTLLPRWPLNYFVDAKLPPDARVVAFTGKPDPDDALVGRWPELNFRQRLYKHVQPTPWIGEHWR